MLILFLIIFLKKICPSIIAVKIFAKYNKAAYIAAKLSDNGIPIILIAKNNKVIGDKMIIARP